MSQPLTADELCDIPALDTDSAASAELMAETSAASMLTPPPAVPDTDSAELTATQPYTPDATADQRIEEPVEVEPTAHAPATENDHGMSAAAPTVDSDRTMEHDASGASHADIQHTAVPIPVADPVHTVTESTAQPLTPPSPQTQSPSRTAHIPNVTLPPLPSLTDPSWSKILLLHVLHAHAPCLLTALQIAAAARELNAERWNEYHARWQEQRAMTPDKLITDDTISKSNCCRVCILCSLPLSCVVISCLLLRAAIVVRCCC